MLTFLFGFLLAGLLFLSISLQKTYHHVPVKELKRQTKQGDQLSALFYRVVAYGVSLDLLLWIIIGITAGVFLVFLTKNYPWPVALFGSIATIWFGFAWLPSSHISRPGVLAAKASAKPMAWTLEWLHTPLTRLAHHISRFRPVTVHTGLYTKQDFLELIDQQEHQIDNRIHRRDLALAAQALLVSDKTIAEIMTPWNKVKKVATHDMVGPILMDELHKTHHAHFPVFQGGDKNDLVGILNIADMLDAKEGGFVKDIMTKRIYYLHEDEKVSDSFLILAQTKHPMFLVINDKEDIVGALSLTELLTQIVGDVPKSDFVNHDSKSAVVAKRKPKYKPVDAEIIVPDGDTEEKVPEELEKTETKPEE